MLRAIAGLASTRSSTAAAHDAGVGITEILENSILGPVTLNSGKRPPRLQALADAQQLIGDRPFVSDQRDLRRRDSGQLGQPGRLGDVGANRGDNDTRLDGEEIDTGEGHAYPGINHDAFIEHVVEDIDYARAGGSSVQNRLT